MCKVISVSGRTSGVAFADDDDYNAWSCIFRGSKFAMHVLMLIY